MSYRIRGRVARTQINRVAITIVFTISHELFIIDDDPVMNTTVRSLIIRILAYSAIKIRAKLLLPYSTLNPDTSSDSPSAKSNGVRLVSARLVITQEIRRGIAISLTHEKMFIDMIDMSMWWWTISADSRISDMDTSYEMVCATPRSAPSSAYFEFEHHPAINVVYTFILDTHRKYRAPNEINIDGLECG